MQAAVRAREDSLEKLTVMGYGPARGQHADRLDALLPHVGERLDEGRLVEVRHHGAVRRDALGHLVGRRARDAGGRRDGAADAGHRGAGPPQQPAATAAP